MTVDLEEKTRQEDSTEKGVRQDWSESEHGNWELGPRAQLQGMAALGCRKDLSFQTDTNMLEVVCS